MDSNMQKIHMLQVDRTIKALEKNAIEAHFVPSRKQVVPTVAAMLQPGEQVAVGGSMTLFETGVIDLLRNGQYQFFDRYQNGLSKDEIDEIYRKSFFVDSYLASANALTEHGEVYCVDGRSNRVAAMLYGPKQVILIVSWDKIVPDLVGAIIRVKEVAAPANANRLDVDTYCTKSGRCMHPVCDPHHLMAISPGACDPTICSNYVVFSHQQIKGRMKVLIVGESLGY